jgi:hypothetical protein
LTVNINIIKENKEAVTDTSTEVSLQVNTEKTNHMLRFRHQNAGKIENIKAANRSLKMWQNIPVFWDENK